MKALVLILSFPALATISSAFDQSHKALTSLFQDHVTAKGVHYEDFKKDQPKLKTYLSDLSKITSTEFESWKKSDQLAFLINLYNAATIDLVLDNYPIRSFKDEVGGKSGPWKIKFIKLLGQTYSLDQIEHELIRKNYNEPRIHFALNCASEGCPALRREAFIGSKLETQLQEQTISFLENKKNNRVSKSSLALSPLFDWFKEDFVKKSGSVEAFLDPYFPKISIRPGKAKISYTDYGWSLNEA